MSRKSGLRSVAEARKFLREQGITAEAFARRHGLSRDAVHNLLTGRVQGKYGKSHAAAVALGMKRGLPDPIGARPDAN